MFFIVAFYLYLNKRPKYKLDIYKDRLILKYKDKKLKDRIIYIKDIEEFFYMYQYVAIKEKDKDWFFITDEVGFGVGNCIQEVHKEYFIEKYKKLFDDGKEIEFKYFPEKATNKEYFKNLSKKCILNKEYLKIDDRVIYLKDINDITYHPNNRNRHDPVDIAFLDIDGNVIYIFLDRTISNYLLFHDLIKRSLMINNNKYREKLESIKKK